MQLKSSLLNAACGLAMCITSLQASAQLFGVPAPAEPAAAAAPAPAKPVAAPAVVAPQAPVTKPAKPLKQSVVVAPVIEAPKPQAPVQPPKPKTVSPESIALIKSLTAVYKWSN